MMSDVMHGYSEPERIDGLLQQAFEMGFSEPAEAIAAARSALALATTAGDTERSARAHGRLGDLHHFIGNLDEAQAASDRSIALAVEHGHPRVEAHARYGRGAFAYATASFHESYAELTRALELARATSYGELELAAHATLGHVCHALGRTDEAVDHLRRAGELNRAMGESDGRHHESIHLHTSITSALGALLALDGDHDAAVEQHAQVVATLDRSVVSDHLLGFALNNLGSALVDAGRPDEARPVLERLMSGPLMDNPTHATRAHMTMVRMLHALGELDAATFHVAAGLALIDAVADGYDEVDMRIAAGALFRARGDTATALDYHLKALAIVERSGARRHDLLSELAHDYRALGDHARAFELLDEAASLRVKQLSEESQTRARSLRDWHELQIAQREAELARVREEGLRQQLDRQRAELASQTLQLARQSEMLARFRNEIRSILSEADRAESAIREIRSKLQELPCEAIDWGRFESEFQQTYPEFRERLLESHPDLSKMEVKVCSMIKLKLSSADIAAVFCLSERTVDTHRRNIRRKLGVPARRELAEVLDEIA